MACSFRCRASPQNIASPKESSDENRFGDCDMRPVTRSIFFQFLVAVFSNDLNWNLRLVARSVARRQNEQQPVTYKTNRM